jgi:hypothetical protein
MMMLKYIKKGLSLKMFWQRAVGYDRMKYAGGLLTYDIVRQHIRSKKLKLK